MKRSKIFLNRAWYIIIAFILIHQSLSCADFHDFDAYQYKLTAEEIELKIRKYLEKDPEIKNYYHLTSQSFSLGDLDHQQIDYVLYLCHTPLSCCAPPKKNKKKEGLKNVKIAIDPGHFGGVFAELEERYVVISAEKTRNYQPIRFHEGDLTYLTALELERLLKAEGALVFMTRERIGEGAIGEDFFKWLEMHSDLRKDLPLSKIFRNYYNREDLTERAKKINAFSPDITVIIHYNAHLTDQEKAQKTLLTQSNYNLAFIPGAFCKGELKSVDDRYEFLRLIVTDHIEESLKLSESITAQFVKQLDVPLIFENEKTSYIDTACLIQKRGIYCRNLVLTRLVHSPMCYGETLVQNNQNEVYKLSECNTSIAGIPCCKRNKEVARAYFEGIKDYFNNR
jgi:N-acetylmuramoyl-L-alanine amidase